MLRCIDVSNKSKSTLLFEDLRKMTSLNLHIIKSLQNLKPNLDIHLPSLQSVNRHLEFNFSIYYELGF